MKNGILALALAVASFGTAAAAENFFTCGNYLESGQTLDLGLIVTEAEGVVEVYEFRTGERGDMLGSTPLNAGANANVRVSTDMPVRDDVLAVLMVGGEFVEAKHFHIHK